MYSCLRECNRAWGLVYRWGDWLKKDHKKYVFQNSQEGKIWTPVMGEERQWWSPSKFSSDCFAFVSEGEKSWAESGNGHVSGLKKVCEEEASKSMG